MHRGNNFTLKHIFLKVANVTCNSMAGKFIKILHNFFFLWKKNLLIFKYFPRKSYTL